MTPRVSVVLPVFDAERFLDEAIVSIRNQTFESFELLVVDDGSTDASASIAAEHARRDERVRAMRRPHRGLVAALNEGLELARGEYVARADADDVNLPRRLERQVGFLDARPDVGLCGGAVLDFDSAGANWAATDSGVLHAQLIFQTGILHPTVVLRAAVLHDAGLRYDDAFRHAEDFDLWERACRVTRLANLSEPLVRYRRHAGQVSERFLLEQREAAGRVRRRQLEALGLGASDSDVALHERISCDHVPSSRDEVREALRWLERLAEANRLRALYPEPAFSRVLAYRFVRFCVHGADLGPSIYRDLFGSRIADRRRLLMPLLSLLARRYASPAFVESSMQAVRRLGLRGGR